MLAYKAWRESQVRFLVSAGALLWFCSVFLLVRHTVHDASQRPYADFVENTIYGTGIRSLYVTFVIVLGLGGLLQERARGTAAFTLSLPVGRARLVAARAIAGLGEVIGLAAVPALVVSTLSRFVNEAYPVTDAVRLSGRWAVVGAALFAVAFLLSAVLAGPYSALAVSIASFFGYSLIVNAPFVRQHPALNLFNFMDGSQPVAAMGLVVPLVAAAVVAGAAWITERQDF